MIENHREVVQFACGILDETDASPITNYVAKVLSEHTHKDINNGGNVIHGKSLSLHGKLSLLGACLKEGGVPLVTPYLTWYPACGYPLAEVLTNTNLVVITDIHKNDPLELKASPAQIILDIDEADSDMFDRLWQALHSIPANIIGWQCGGRFSANRTKLKNFSHLKRLQITAPEDSELEDLALSIDSWGAKPPLLYCYIVGKTILQTTPGSLVTAVSRCTHLKHLDLSWLNLLCKFSILMACPPPALRGLVLSYCLLNADDIDHMTKAFREDRLMQLEELDISYNPVGEAALGSLLQVISNRPHALKLLNLRETDVGTRSKFSKQFVSEWKNKLPNINVKWS